MIRQIVKALAAATAVTMGLSGATADAAGIRSIAGTNCIKTGPSGGNVTQICGYVNDPSHAAMNAVSVYVDFDRQLASTATARSCRRSYTNSSFNCTSPTSISSASGSADIGVTVWGGLAGLSNEWDYFSVELTYPNQVGGQTQTVQMWGIGANTN